MIKSELIQKIAAANQHLYHRDIERIVNVIFNEIVDALARGDRVELRGFGAFTVWLVAGSQFAAAVVSRIWAGSHADRRGARRGIVLGLLLAAS